MSVTVSIIVFSNIILIIILFWSIKINTVACKYNFQRQIRAVVLGDGVVEGSGVERAGTLRKNEFSTWNGVMVARWW